MFGQDRAAQQEPGLQADDGQNRDECVAQRVFEHHRRAAQALGPRRSDIVAAQDLEHPTARNLGHDGQRDRPERERRQDQVPKRVERGPSVAGYERIEHDEVRPNRYGIHQRDAARDRKQVESDIRGQDGEDVDEHPAQPKHRDRDAEQDCAHRNDVERSIAAQRREDARRDADRHRHDERAERQFDGRRKVLGQFSDDGLRVGNRAAEIAAQQVHEIERQLDIPGFIQP